MNLREVAIPNANDAQAARAPAYSASHRSPIDPSLPPDHPLEPGTRLPSGSSTPSERIAASQVVLNGLPAGAHEPASSTNFIQAARAVPRRLPPPRPRRPVVANAPANSKKVTASSDMAQKALAAEHHEAIENHLKNPGASCRRERRRYRARLGQTGDQYVSAPTMPKRQRPRRSPQLHKMPRQFKLCHRQ